MRRAESTAWKSPAATVRRFSAYANVAYPWRKAKDWIRHNSCSSLTCLRPEPLDLSGPRSARDRFFGVSYTWKEATASTRVCMDAIYGSGLRTGRRRGTGRRTHPQRRQRAGLLLRSTVAWSRVLNWPSNNFLKARLDIVNLTDNIYQLRNGTGVGNAAQYGERLGFFGSLSYVF